MHVPKIMVYMHRIIQNLSYQINNNANHGVAITNCIVRQFGVKYAMPAIMMYDKATGNISSIPIMVRHLPLTSSTTNTKLTIVTPIEANPIIVLITMNIVRELENANTVPNLKEKRVQKLIILL